MRLSHWLKVLSLAAWMASPGLGVCAEAPEPATELAVQVGNIVKTTLRRYVLAYGTVEPEPAGGGKPPASAKIAAPVVGLLAQIRCEEGLRLEKGAPLFQLDSRAVDALVAKAEVAVAFAEKNFARKQQMLPAENVSRKLYDEAEQTLETARKELANAQTQRALLRIDAPLSGTVTAVYAKIGEAVGLGSVLAELVDLDRLVVAIRVPSQEAAALKIGQPADISARALPSVADAPATQRGTLLFISPQVDLRSDTVLARVSLARGGGLRPGQFVGVRIVVEERSARLAVPVESLVTREGASFIAVVDHDQARQTPVKPGLRDGGLVEVEGEGLREGLKVVTQGVYGLPAQTRVRVAQ